jgi:hypothetical protein
MNSHPFNETTSARDPQALFNESLVLLASLRDALAALVRDLNNGQLDVLADISAKQLEIEIALKRAFEMERKFNDWQNKDRGGPKANAIDFDNARNEIGCRLARLRACCRSN